MYNQGLAYLYGTDKKYDLKKSFEIFAQLSKTDIEAKFMMANGYYNGCGTKINVDLAKQIFLELAQNHDHTLSKVRCLCMRIMKFTEEEKMRTVDDLVKMVQANNPIAMLLLGYLFSERIISRHRYIKKFTSLYFRAARCGYLPATIYVGKLYYTGHYLKKNIDKAYRLFKAAEHTGYPQAWFLLGIYAEDIKRDYAEANKYYQMAAEAGLGEAIRCIGLLYRKGRGVEHNNATAFKFFLDAVDNSCTVAYNDLAYAHLMGLGVEVDNKKAVEYYEKGVARFDSLAMSSLALYYYKEKNYYKAIEYNMLAALHGSQKSLSRLCSFYNHRSSFDAKVMITQFYYKNWEAFSEKFKDGGILFSKFFKAHVDIFNVICLEFGIGIKKNLDKIGVAIKGEKICKALRAFHYLNGIGVEKDTDRALELFKEVYAKDKFDFCYYIGYMYQFRVFDDHMEEELKDKPAIYSHAIVYIILYMTANRYVNRNVTACMYYELSLKMGNFKAFERIAKLQLHSNYFKSLIRKKADYDGITFEYEL